MPFDPIKHHRRSIRLKGYDYTQMGAYFVTICTYNLIKLFGEVIDQAVLLNIVGRVVDEQWRKTAEIRPNVELDEYIIMPNHLHGIIMIYDEQPAVGLTHAGATIVRATRRVAPTLGSKWPKGPKPGSLGAIIGQFKSMATKGINRLNGMIGQPIWQRNYHEHIIRSDQSLNRIRGYIANNPLQWHLDNYNPDSGSYDEVR